MQENISNSISDQDILELSLRIEREGQAYYQRLSDHVSDTMVKQFVEQMHKEETQHEKLFRAMLETKGGESYGWENKKDLSEFVEHQLQADIFPDLSEILGELPRFENLNDAVDFAVEAELVAAEFYFMLGEYCDDMEAKSSLALLERAENEHIKQVLHIKQKLLETQ